MNAVLGINAVFHDPAAALVVDGEIVAAAEEERFTRRKHGKSAVPFATGEIPEHAARWCLEHAGIAPHELRAVAYSYDPALAPQAVTHTTRVGALLDDGWESLRTLYAQRAPLFLRSALPGLDPAIVRFVPHHVAHAASAYLACGWDAASVLVVDGRGERSSHLSGAAEKGELEVVASQSLPHSLGLLYESATEHLGFRRAVERLRAAGVGVAIVTNQPAVADGAATRADVDRVHARVDALLGPFRGFFVCPHAPADACGCRKPQPGLLRDALGAAGIAAAECALVGDIASDVDAARALGMRAVLVPTPVTRAEEVRAAPELAPDLDTAARRLLRGAP